MKCPQCKGYALEPAQLEPGLIAAGCPNCQGTLLPLMNYRFWIERHHPEQLHANRSVETAQVEDVKDAKSCPKCARFMTKYQIGNEIKNRLDLCANCDEAWLDKGEWSLLKELDIADQLPRIFTDAWQRNLRRERQENLQKKRYTELLGEAGFQRLEEFKNWFDAHPRKADIQLYLNAKQRD